MIKIAVKKPEKKSVKVESVCGTPVSEVRTCSTGDCDEAECKYYRFDINFVDDDASSSVEGDEVFSLPSDAPAALTSCIADIISQCGGNEAWSRRGVYDSAGVDFNNPNLELSELAELSQQAGELAQIDDCLVRALAGTTSGSVIVDEHCQRVTDENAESLVCDTYDVLYIQSPISLIWEDGHDIDTNQALTSFSLDLSGESKVTTWKASSAAPLLVYDPEHRGEITSATQLFGEYTFGGKSPDGISPVSMRSSLGKPWTNGYEALAVLDLDRDGYVSESELSPLALWFDSNRDGVSQKGEVRSVIEMGVIRIRTSWDRASSSGDLYSLNGYQRVLEGGEVYSGQSVDWYGTVFPTLEEALSKLGKKTSSFASSSSDKADNKQDDLLEPTSSVDKGSFAGSWRWKYELAGQIMEGVLILSLDGERFRGSSVIEIPLRENSGGARSLIRSASVTGELSPFNKNKAELRIEDRSGQVTTSVVLLTDSYHLSGESSVSDGQKSYSYQWEAERIVPKK